MSQDPWTRQQQRPAGNAAGPHHPSTERYGNQYGNAYGREGSANVVPYEPPAPAYAPSPYPPQPASPTGFHAPQPIIVTAPQLPSSGVAVWALVMGIIGILSGWCLLGVPCLLAVVLGHVGMADTRNNQKSGRGMAVAGLVLGYVTLAPAIIVFFWLVMGGVMVGAGA